MIATIDVTTLHAGDPGDEVARAIDRACREHGFFSIVGHGISAQLVDDLQHASRAFFALPEARKLELAMARAGRRWRGYFPVGGELTSGIADAKAGLYFGRELPADDARVIAGLPLHGPNLWPDADVPALRPAVLAWIAAAADVARLVRRSRVHWASQPTTSRAPAWRTRRCCSGSFTIRRRPTPRGASASTPTTGS